MQRYIVKHFIINVNVVRFNILNYLTKTILVIVY